MEVETTAVASEIHQDSLEITVDEPRTMVEECFDFTQTTVIEIPILDTITDDIANQQPLLNINAPEFIPTAYGTTYSQPKRRPRTRKKKSKLQQPTSTLADFITVALSQAEKQQQV